MVAIENDGTVSFKVFLPHAAKVDVMGDFTDWGRSRLKMVREYPGWWRAKTKVPPGPHSFCYVIDDSIHLADYAAHGVKLDGSGNWVSELSIRP
ncbi:MAG: glycogen-binding domain-containing protein [Phycisphaerales bacterium]